MFLAGFSFCLHFSTATVPMPKKSTELIGPDRLGRLKSTYDKAWKHVLKPYSFEKFVGYFGDSFTKKNRQKLLSAYALYFKQVQEFSKVRAQE